MLMLFGQLRIGDYFHASVPGCKDVLFKKVSENKAKCHLGEYTFAYNKPVLFDAPSY